MGINAIRSAAVRNDLSIGIEGRNDPIQIRKSSVERTGDMAGCVFVSWPDVQDGYGSFAKTSGQNIPTNGFRGLASTRQTSQNVFDLSAVAFGNEAQQLHEFESPGIRQPVDNGISIAAAGDEARAAQLLKMLRAIGCGETSLTGQRLDAALHLRELFQDHQPRGRRQGVRNQSVFLQKS